MTSKFAGLSLEAEQPRRMTILHPATRQPLPNAWIDLHPSWGQRARDHERAVLDRRLAEPSVKPTSALIEEQSSARLAALTSAWSLTTLDGKPLDVACTPDNARALYAEPGMAWLRAQVIEFIDAPGNWLPGNAKA